MITYNAKLTASFEDMKLIMDLMEEYRIVVNKASEMQFKNGFKSITEIHKAFYYLAREDHSDFPSQMVIKAEQESLSTYRAIKSNKHKIKKCFKKKNLSIRLDKRLFSKTSNKNKIKITTKEGRKTFSIALYSKLKGLMNTYEYVDPLIFVRDGELFISLTFNTTKEPQKESLCLGVDLGIRRVAACSDGRLIIDKKFNADKRKLRYLKSKLKSKGTKSANKHLNKLRNKEKNKNKNQTHLVANEILKTNANIIALENLKGIKAKKYKTQNKNAISQVPFFELRRVLTYKAINIGKHVCLVSPAYTSQIDNVSGIKEGDRKGCRFYAKSGLIYDADINAAINIARRSKHPISIGNFLDGLGVVNRPIAFKTCLEKSK